MLTILKRIKSGRYDPIKYWNNRLNPNAPEGLTEKRVAFDTEYISSAVKGLYPILELGPGVGRTFSAYEKGCHITALDISKRYSYQLKEASLSLGLELEQYYLSAIHDPFPFGETTFKVGVASQVLMHIPPEHLRHTLSELIRVCKKIVIITSYSHGFPVRFKKGPDLHCFNHDYFSLCTELGCIISDLIENEGRILFTFHKQ